MTSKTGLIELLKDITTYEKFEEELSKIPADKIKGDYFELFCKAYLETVYPEVDELKSVKLFSDCEKATLDRLNLRFGKDYGIDLVAITKEDKLWAIQAKFRSSRQLSWAELSTFLGASQKADFRLVIGNIEKIPTPQKTANFASILVDDLLRLDIEDFKKIKNALGIREVFHKKEPRPHQLNAIHKAVQFFKTQDKGKMIHACGTGKRKTMIGVIMLK